MNENLCPIIRVMEDVIASQSIRRGMFVEQGPKAGAQVFAWSKSGHTEEYSTSPLRTFQIFKSGTGLCPPKALPDKLVRRDKLTLK